MSSSVTFKLLKYFVPIFVTLNLSWWFVSVCNVTLSWWVGNLFVSSALAVVAWTVAYFVYDQLNCETVQPKGKAVLITGCDTGFGHELAIRLDRYGFTVFAGVLFPAESGATKLVQECSSKLHILKMDVTKQADVLSAVKSIKESSLPLWAIVNNAGIGAFSPFDWGHDVDEHKKVFEVNVFGVIRVTKYFLPLLRKSHGRIVNVASLAGRISPEGLSHYGMAKHSVRVFSDVVRRELYTKNVKVITLEPTFYQTDIINSARLKEQQERVLEQTPEENREFYKKTSNISGLHMSMQFVNQIARKNVMEVVDTLVKAVTLEEPKPYYRCCGYQDIATWAVAHAPETLLDAAFYLGAHNPAVRSVIRLVTNAKKKV